MTTSPKLTRGMLGHEGCLAYYKRRHRKWLKNLPDVIKHHLSLIVSEEREEAAKELGLVQDIVERFIAWVSTHDESKPVMAEKTLKTELRMEDSGEIIPFEFTVDTILEFPKGGLWLQEIKTTSRLQTEAVMEMNPQTGLYFLLLQPHLKGKQLDGVIYTQIPTKVTKSGAFAYQPLVRFFSSVTPEQSFQFYKELAAQYYTMQRCEESGVYWRNPTVDCSWDCHQYNLLCRAEAQGGDADLVRSTYFNRREPRF